MDTKIDCLRYVAKRERGDAPVTEQEVLLLRALVDKLSNWARQYVAEDGITSAEQVNALEWRAELDGPIAYAFKRFVAELCRLAFELKRQRTRKLKASVRTALLERGLPESQVRQFQKNSFDDRFRICLTEHVVHEIQTQRPEDTTLSAAIDSVLQDVERITALAVAETITRAARKIEILEATEQLPHEDRQLAIEKAHARLNHISVDLTVDDLLKAELELLKRLLRGPQENRTQPLDAESRMRLAELLLHPDPYRDPRPPPDRPSLVALLHETAHKRVDWENKKSRDVGASTSKEVAITYAEKKLQNELHRYVDDVYIGVREPPNDWNKWINYRLEKLIIDEQGRTLGRQVRPQGLATSSFSALFQSVFEEQANGYPLFGDLPPDTCTDVTRLALLWAGEHLADQDSLMEWFALDEDTQRHRVGNQLKEHRKSSYPTLPMQYLDLLTEIVAQSIDAIRFTFESRYGDDT